MESSKVMNVRRKCFIPGAMFGSFSFININLSGNKELFDDHGIKNMLEVAVTFRILQLLYKECASSKQKISIAVLSPYPAQVECMQQKLENHYQNDKFFKVNVECTHNYEGGQVDVVMISTGGVHEDECIDLSTSTPQDSNVYFKWARHCLWILGDEKMQSAGSIWESLILDAKARQCFFHANEHKDLARVIVEVNKDLHQLDELLSGETALFRSTTWKVLFSSNFRISFSKIESLETKKLVLLMLLKISTGWRPKGSSTAASVAKSPYSELLKEFKVRGLHLICTIDIGKETHYTQVLKVWDILPFHKIAELVQRLEGIIGMYTQEYIDCCKARCGAQRGSEFPMKWPGMSAISRYKNQAIRCDKVFMDGASGNSCVENVNVSESLMLMKFYSLSSGEVDNMISGCDGEAIGLPFELTEQEKDVVSFEKSSFILGRSGTGKTTVLTMKLFQNEQLHHLACEGFHEAMDQSNEEVKQDVLHQLFVTFSPKLCFAVRQQVDQWKRLTCGGSLLAQSRSVSIDDIDKMMVSDTIPDHFIHLPHEAYPLIITFHKFLLMLDGTVGTSYFERFPYVRKHSTSRLVFLEQNMRSMDVTYDKFCSKYWPHFNEKFTKKFDPSTVYTEIMSVIKGGLTTGDQARNGILSSDNYVSLCNGRTSILDAQKRRIIYAIFLQYEKKKTEKGDFDLADLVNDLHQRLEVEGYNGDPIDYVYIDEVQDLSMSQIALFKYVCTNVHEGFAFCGDTARAIAKGIGFRFEDIRCLFFRMFLLGPEKGQISKILQLNENFRTHRGVVNLAQSVIDLLCHFFPLFVDHLSPETSRIRGELPILLETDINNDAVKTIFGRNGDGCQQFIGFGAEQAVLVRDERLKDKVFDIVGKKSIVLTIMESKGLEFQDVLLYDFFSTSSFSNEWRIIYEYMKENGLPNLPSTCALSPSFNMEKHNVLCSELKQLYVAITRTRQRLWICETTGFSQPIYDYWKKLNLVEVKRLNDSFADKMQIASSKEEWKLRGVKLFHEKNFSMAQMCFLKAADEYSARLTEAYHLRALADGPRISQLERKKHFKNAAMLFREIGKNELAAECFYEMEDFECMMECVRSFCSEHEMRNFLTKKRCLAQLILLEIEWGNFEEAVNVARRKPDPVVEAYLLLMGGLGREYYSSLIILWHVLSNSPIFHGTDEPIAQKNELLTKAVSIAKSDSDIFYQLCEIAKSPPASEFERKKLFKDAAKLFREIGKIELAAECFYEMEDFECMMECVRSFCSEHEMRNFLTKKRCLAQLILLEIEWGNFDSDIFYQLCEIAKSPPASEFERKKLFKDAAKLFREIGKIELAAECFYEMEDFECMMECVRSFCSEHEMRNFLTKKRCLAQLILLEIEWGNFDSDIFYQLCEIAKSPPASEFERKKLFKDAAKLFREIGKIELAAECFYEMEDFECMMECVRSFCSEHEMRNFLTKKRCLAQLILLEIEWGNFDSDIFYQLCEIAKSPPASEFERKKLFKDAAKLIREIGKIELAAECFYEMEDFECMMECVRSFCSEHEMRNFLTKKRCLAQLILLEIEWGNFDSDIFYQLCEIAKSPPASEFERKKLFKDAAKLFREIGKIELAAECFYEMEDFECMMECVRSFCSEHEMRNFLTKKRCLAQLILLEIEWGNFDSDIFYQLCEIAKSPPASEFERKKLFKDAAKLFREIGKNELAAKCFYMIKDYRTAGDIYWSESMMEKAGNCFCRAKCYELAVEAYDKAGSFAKCLSACADGKLFEIGFQLIGRWGGCGDAELEFYHSAAYYYFDVKDSISMMKCVRSFRSKDDMRIFLNKKNCLDELISLEREWGNFVEAAKVASLKPDPVLQADLLCMGGLSREPSLIILWHVFSNSPIFTEEPFKQKDELLMKSVSIAKSNSDIFYQFVCKEAEILSKGETEEFLEKGVELIYWYKTNALAMSSDRVKKTREIEKIEKYVLDLLCSLFKSGNRSDELLLLEEIRAEFVEAAKIGIEDDHSIEAALRRLWYVFFGCLWSHGKRAWPLKNFKQKNKLLDDAKSYLQYHPDSQESELVHSEISVLSSLEINLSQMWMYLRETPREKSLRIHYLISRSILDVHLHSCSKAYICNENHGTMNHLEGVLSQDMISVDGLIYFWSYWKGLILELINWSCMRNQVGKDGKIYEDFIFNYFGLRRYDRDMDGFYVVLNAEAQWVKQMNPVMHKNGYLDITPARKFPSVASRYWCSELVFVAEKVLNKLKTLHTYSTVKNFSIHQQTKILASLFQVAKSLQKCKLPYDWIRANRIVDRYFQLCVERLLSNVFHLDWKNAQSKEMISLRGSETFLNMLEEAINIKSKSWKDLTHGQLGTVAMIFLGSRIGFNDDIKRKIRSCSSMNWRDLFDKLTNGSSSSKSGDLARSLRNVLQESFFGSWWRVDGCMSAACFLYLMERLVILSFRFNGYVFTTRSSCVEWVANYAHEDWSMDSNGGALDTMMNIHHSLVSMINKMLNSNGGALDTMMNIHHSLVSMVNKMLNSEDDLINWLTRSKEPSSSYAILVLRLTLLLSLICANSGQHHDHLLNVLQRSHFVSILPSAFHEALIKGLNKDHLVDAVAVACEEIDNPLVVMSFTKDVSESLCQNAIFLEMTKTDLSREMMIEVLYP